ncbi:MULTISPECIES: hypothetical protein [Streptomonospora]|uniref:Uncharacterized protein n=2 Tax=Streptomonospora TaxID=104204 RepID=A0ABV9SQ45_9ACTN
MTVETPPSGIPVLAAGGHRLDCGADDPLWLRALCGLSAELHSRGLQARMDAAVGAVEAVGAGPAEGSAPRVQRALLRPHRGRLWWWMCWGAQPVVPPPHRTPLTPAARPADAARRIAGVLAAPRD